LDTKVGLERKADVARRENPREPSNAG
jgi:hypothetical protein